MSHQMLLSDEEWVIVVRRRLGVTTGVKVLEVASGQHSDQLIGFLGDHIQVQLTVQQDESSSIETLYFFIKRIPTAVSFHTDYVLASNAFKKETSFYSIVVEHYRKYGLLKSNEDVTTTCIPECYLTRHDLLVQENLVVNGFKMFDIQNYMNYAHCELVLKSLAMFHAASIVLEEKLSLENEEECKLNELYPDILSENMFVQDGKSSITQWVRTTMNSLLTWVGWLPKYGTDTVHYESIKQKTEDELNGMFDYVKPSEKYKNVISHGDLWTNNIMFQYGDDEKTPQDVRFVDFQVVRYVPPAFDVMMFLHLTSSRAFRLSNIDRLLTVYHEELSRELQRHSVDAHQLLPWADFRESCRHYSTVGRIIAPLYHQFILMPSHVVTEQMGTEENMKSFILDDKKNIILKCYNEYHGYRNRISEEIQELVECVVLKTVDI